jgi:hypothetical protein
MTLGAAIKVANVRQAQLTELSRAEYRLRDAIYDGVVGITEDEAYVHALSFSRLLTGSPEERLAAIDVEAARYQDM